MIKNIIVCSDGTGNKGGYGADSNVFKIYDYLDLGNNSTQVAFYDHGVGTSSNPISKALGGAMGVGFKQNVMDGYEFLCRHYQPGDHIYLFGFSRGAATVRALAYMVQTSGLINFQLFPAGSKAFTPKLHEAWEVYQKYQGNDTHPDRNKWLTDPSNHIFKFDDGTNKIHFMGIWDTVSALGFPENMGQGMGLLFNSLNWVLKRFGLTRHKYQADKAVEQVFHALALDDNRVAFLPQIWYESRKKAEEPFPDVEQVWFAGAHSNVGGGYPRAGMSNVALAWMMKWACATGLKFDAGALDEVNAKANVDDILYDPRDGLAMLFRYTARDVEQLCHAPRGEDGIIIPLGEVKVHDSVFKRMENDIKQKQGDDFGYAPGFLPVKFKVVKETTNPLNPYTATPCVVLKQDALTGLRKKLLRIEEGRKFLFFLFGWLLGFLGLCSWAFWQNPPVDFSVIPSGGPEWPHHIADVLAYPFPAMFQDLIRYIVAFNPKWIGVVGGIAFVMVVAKVLLKGAAARTSDKIRVLFEEAFTSPPNTKVEGMYERVQSRWSLRLGWFREVFGWIFFLAAMGFAFLNGNFAATIKQPLPEKTQQTVQTIPCSPHTVTVRPWKYWNRSGYFLEQGARYQITPITPMAGEEWKDASVTANIWGWQDWDNLSENLKTNPTGENLSLWLIKKASRFWARSPDDPLFRLMGAVDANCQKGKKCPVQFSIPREIEIGCEASNAPNTDKCTTKREKPATFTLVAPASGELLTFANDWPFMYFNNNNNDEPCVENMIRFTIQRLGEHTACPAPMVAKK